MDDEKGGKILIVDDEADIRTVLSRRLRDLGYDCDAAEDGYEALKKIHDGRFDLVLSDIKMPRLDGIEMLKQLKILDPDMPVVMISALAYIDAVRTALREGAYDYLIKPLDFDEVEFTVERALERGRLLRKNREYQRNLEKKVEERTRELSEALMEIKRTYQTTILVLGSALETRDVETQAHCLRVAQYSLALAKALGIDDRERLTNIERGAYLHDIGKIGVPDRILRKPGPLTEDEMREMRKHPELGRRMIKGIEFLRGAIPIVFCHHERYDGSGYPRGSKGEEIPLEARIFSVADALDAMISDRPYRKALPFSEARGEILRGRGGQFDPKVVKAFDGIPGEEWLRMRDIFEN